MEELEPELYPPEFIAEEVRDIGMYHEYLSYPRLVKTLRYLVLQYYSVIQTPAIILISSVGCATDTNFCLYESVHTLYTSMSAQHTCNPDGCIVPPTSLH